MVVFALYFVGFLVETDCAETGTSFIDYIHARVLEAEQLRDVVADAEYDLFLSFELHNPLNEYESFLPQLNLFLEDKSVDKYFKTCASKHRQRLENTEVAPSPL